MLGDDEDIAHSFSGNAGLVRIIRLLCRTFVIRVTRSIALVTRVTDDPSAKG
jgi:hypothetical protein